MLIALGLDSTVKISTLECGVFTVFHRLWLKCGSFDYYLFYIKNLGVFCVFLRTSNFIFFLKCEPTLIFMLTKYDD